MDIDRQTDWHTETRKNSFFLYKKSTQDKKTKTREEKTTKATEVEDWHQWRSRRQRADEWNMKVAFRFGCLFEMLGWSVTGVRRWMGGERVTNWRHRFCFLAHPSFLNVHPTPPPLREHHPTVSDTFQESFKYRRTYHQPRLFWKNRLKLDYKYTEKDTHQDRDSALVPVKAKKGGIPTTRSPPTLS